MNTQETWLTIRVRCSSPGAAVGMLDRFARAEEIRPTVATGLLADPPTQFQLVSGTYPVGTALIGTPGGDEFERALQ